MFFQKNNSHQQLFPMFFWDTTIGIDYLRLFPTIAIVGASDDANLFKNLFGNQFRNVLQNSQKIMTPKQLATKHVDTSKHFDPQTFLTPQKVLTPRKYGPPNTFWPQPRKNGISLNFDPPKIDKIKCQKVPKI